MSPCTHTGTFLCVELIDALLGLPHISLRFASPLICWIEQVCPVRQRGTVHCQQTGAVQEGMKCTSPCYLGCS